jgi:glycosyltransferase involved in cell wall biosynthesis
MAVFAIAMVRDEADIVEQTVRHMLGQVHEVIVADNGSTDGTREILEQLPIVLLDDPEVGYYQSRKMTALAARAAQQGADWIVPFDADECWYSPFGKIADILADLPQAVAAAALYDHVPTAVDPEGAPLDRIGWRRHTPAELPKVACRAALPVTIEQGNHGAHYPTGQVDGQLVVRHFPYRSAEQFVRKARNGAQAYAATDLPDDQGKHWRDYGALLDAHGP